MEKLSAAGTGPATAPSAENIAVAWNPMPPALKERLQADLLAGLTVALMSIPQGMAYAIVAGLPPVYGLYSSIVLTLVVSLTGSSRLLVSGPTNAISITVAGVAISASHPIAATDPVSAIVLLTFLTGGIQFLFGVLKVGNLAQFISRSVLLGYTAGAGLLIIFNQINPLLGFAAVSGVPIWEKIALMLPSLPRANVHTLLLGCGTALLVLAGRRWRPRWPTPLLSMIAAAAVVALFDLESRGVALVGDLHSVLPRLRVPPFGMRLVADLAGAAIAIAILGCIETLSINKRIGMLSGERSNINRDFVALGLSHMVGGFFQCMPGGGSLTRSAMNFESGGRSKFSGIFCGLWVAAILLLFGRWARYIPAASLAGLLVVLGAGLIDPRQIRRAVMATTGDAAVLGVTFLSTLLLHLDTAIYIGVLASLALFVRKASAPHLVEYNLMEDVLREIRDPMERIHPEISIIHVEGELFFGAAEIFDHQVRRLVNDENVRVVILRMKNARNLDATALAALEALHHYLVNSGRLLLISGASRELLRVLRRGGLLKVIGEANVFPAEANLTAATGKALLRAQAFLGGELAPELRVFYDARHAPTNRARQAADQNRTRKKT